MHNSAMLRFSTDQSAADLSRPTVILTAGLPAAGKSSLCQHLFPDITTLSADDLKTDHPDFDPKKQDGEVGQRVHNWSLGEFEKRRVLALAKGATHVLDSTATEISKVSRWIADAHAAGFRVHCLMVEYSLATSLARNAQRDRIVPVWAIEEKAAVVRESFAALAVLSDSHETIDND